MIALLILVVGILGISINCSAQTTTAPTTQPSFEAVFSGVRTRDLPISPEILYQAAQLIQEAPGKATAHTLRRLSNATMGFAMHFKTADKNKKKAFVDAVQAFYKAVFSSVKRPVARAPFYEEYGHILADVGEHDAAAAQFQKSVDELMRLRAKTDVLWLSSLVSAAYANRLRGNMKSAEHEYLIAMSYPWYQLRDPIAFQHARDRYVGAVLGLIQVRHGNLKALREIIVVPAVAKIVEPALSAAIREAQREQKMRHE